MLHGKNLLTLKWVCEALQVSRSGYYNWVKRQEYREAKEEKDQADFTIILKAYHLYEKACGSRGIYMRLLHQGIKMNRKKIQRLMRKYQLFCSIRKPNPYKKIARATQENITKPNILNRQFKDSEPKTVILTDITYIPYGQGQVAYLSVMKDCRTKQILAYELSESLAVDFVLNTVTKLLKHHQIPKQQKTLIHSDQGTHYTSIAFQTILKDNELRQSMSRRGNCWDNAPVESFFGHMKDDLPDLSLVRDYSAIQRIVDEHMHYYNNYRYQWDLAKLSPNQFEQYLKTGVHPLSHLIDVA